VKTDSAVSVLFVFTSRSTPAEPTARRVWAGITQIVALYDQLAMIRPNAVVAIDRAAAVAELDGLDAGIMALDAIDADALAEYQPYHAARADLLARAGRSAVARAAYDRAIELTTNPAERRFLAEQCQAIVEN